MREGAWTEPACSSCANTGRAVKSCQEERPPPPAAFQRIGGQFNCPERGWNYLAEHCPQGSS